MTEPTSPRGRRPGRTTDAEIAEVDPLDPREATDEVSDAPVDLEPVPDRRPARPEPAELEPELDAAFDEEADFDEDAAFDEDAGFDEEGDFEPDFDDGPGFDPEFGPGFGSGPGPRLAPGPKPGAGHRAGPPHGPGPKKAPGKKAPGKKAPGKKVPGPKKHPGHHPGPGPEHGSEHGRNRGPGPGRPGGPGGRPGLGFGPGTGFGFGPTPGFGPGFGFGPGGRGGGRGSGWRSRRGDIRAAILTLLAERPMHGYEMIKEIAERSQDLWRPSPGSVYPTLQLLDDEGLIGGSESQGGKRLFDLTDDGRAAADKIATPPWEQIAEGVDQGQVDLRAALGQLVGAVTQAAYVAAAEQQQRLVAILKKARSEIYSLLAESD